MSDNESKNDTESRDDEISRANAIITDDDEFEEFKAQDMDFDDKSNIDSERYEVSLNLA
jgi:hypothetical protein